MDWRSSLSRREQQAHSQKALWDNAIPVLLSSQGCYNKLPQLGGLKQWKLILPQFWRTEVQNQGVGKLSSFWRFSEESVPGLSPSFWWVLAILGIAGLGDLSPLTQSCPTLCDPTDCTSADTSVHGIFQARIPERVAIFSSRGSSQPRDRTYVSGMAGRFLTRWTISEGLAWSRTTPIPASTIEELSGLCACLHLFPSCKNVTSHVGSEPIWMTSLNLSTSAKTLFPNKATVTGARG